eukprot:CAMPEP_0195299382 /NCGR_PEP_ID=MMETSP0707-20130614/25445_1 /TAXON_ID=33640 /ORGANISM="Asterionellopsis glacialis, Strain CCMP134" /LENGTH=345 /DNA_ID=CAMNT_0040361777 /DNA_START=88 /DNA_END=1125 /DNA_ORIENTATION=-
MSSSSSAPEDHWNNEDGFPSSESNINLNNNNNNNGNNDVRQRRLQLEANAKDRFVTGDSLHSLRKKVLELRKNLRVARKTNAHKQVNELERAIIQAQKVDAEFVYSVALERMEEAEAKGDMDAVEQYRQEAAVARSCLPQFNLDGLWVGKYGDHGYEMINITYTGDTLIAYKVTGDKNVPKGEISFQVDLTMELQQQQAQQNNLLQPIELSEDATRQWGTKHLERFSGKGQVAAEGFVNNQWLEGQLILVGDYFSFAWVPLGHQVFFGRPSAELTLKMLNASKDQGVAKKESTQQKQRKEADTRHYLQRCLEETQHLEDDYHVESGGLFMSHKQQDYFAQDGCFE